MEPVDILVATALAIASLRGFFLGLIREAFSLAAMAAAYLAVRIFSASAAEWLETTTEGGVGPALAPWLAGAGVAVAAIVVVVTIGRFLRKGARAIGLGMVDRLAGAILGAAEGALAVAILLALGTAVVGREHPAVADTRSLAALETVEALAQASGARDIDVAAPPRTR